MLNVAHSASVLCCVSCALVLWHWQPLAWAWRRLARTRTAHYHGSVCRLVAALLVALIASCAGGGESPRESVPVVPVQGASWYAEWPLRTYVIRSQEEWQAAWAEVKSVGNPPPHLPVVDFTKSAVVGASIGWAGNCKRLSIRQIQRRGTDYHVEYGFGEPPPRNAGCTALVVPAYAFALVPAPVDHVTFERRDL